MSEYTPELTRELYEHNGKLLHNKFANNVINVEHEDNIQILLTGLIQDDINDAIRKLDSPNFGFDVVKDDLAENRQLIVRVLNADGVSGIDTGIVGRPSSLEDLVTEKRLDNATERWHTQV